MVKIPTPQEIHDARIAAGLTQTEAAALIYKKLRVWQYYENGDRTIDPALWELFQLKLISRHLGFLVQ